MKKRKVLDRFYDKRNCLSLAIMFKLEKCVKYLLGKDKVYNISKTSKSVQKYIWNFKCCENNNECSENMLKNKLMDFSYLNLRVGGGGVENLF
jgi:hypothetical protein